MPEQCRTFLLYYIFAVLSGFDTRELVLVQSVVYALLFKQLIVVAAFHYLTVLHNDYHVGVADG